MPFVLNPIPAAQLRPLPTDVQLSEEEYLHILRAYLAGFPTNRINRFPQQTLLYRVLTTFELMQRIEFFFQVADVDEAKRIPLEMIPILVEFKQRHRLQAAFKWLNQETNQTHIRQIASVLAPLMEEVESLTLAGRVESFGSAKPFPEELSESRNWTANNNKGRSVHLIDSLVNTFKDTEAFVQFMKTYNLPPCSVVDGFTIQQHNSLRQWAGQLNMSDDAEVSHFILELIRFYTNNY